MPWPKRADEALRSLTVFARAALELLLPPSCAACGAGVDARAALCAACDARIERIESNACGRCQECAPEPGGLFCRECAGSQSALTACVAAARFDGAGADWIHRFKYPRNGLRGLDPAPVSVVAAMLREAAQRAPGPAPDWIVPVPLHPRRLRSRGFNPAAEIARRLARERGARFDAVALRRTRDTPSQTGLDRRARRSNVRGAFEARCGRRIRGRVWLIDDVVTTSSTLIEAAIALKSAGAGDVVGVCAARSLSGDRRLRESRAADDRDPPAS